MATFFAVCNVNGPISAEIIASDVDQAIAEFKSMKAQELIDDARTDAEDELDLDGEGKSEDEFEAMLVAAGCKQVRVLDSVNNYHAGTVAALVGGWSIWQLGPHFTFRTDSESGKLKADSYQDACEQLRDMVGDDHEETGAWGWVEDQDGNRLVIGEVP